MADQFGNKGFESWVKNCLGSAKPEILQNVLAVLDKECFESPADLAEFGDRPAELAKLGIPARYASALLQKATIKAADAAEVLTVTSETQSSSGDSASVQRSEALSAENSVSDLADVEPVEVPQEPTEKAEETSFEVLGAQKPSSDTAIQQSAEVLREGAEKAIPQSAEFLQEGEEKAIPQPAEVLQPHAAVVDDAGPSTDSRSPDQFFESSETTQSWCVVEADTLDLAKVGDYVKHSNKIL